MEIDFIFIFMFLALSFFSLVICSYLLKEVIFIFNPIFFILNRIQWILYNPLRLFQKSTNSSFSYVLFKFLLFTGVIPIYWIGIHILLTPLRFINAIYFNILLGWSTNLHDSLAEVINPKRGRFRSIKGAKYFFYWIVNLPIRLIKFVLQNVVIVLEPIIMTGFDTVWSTYTMYHGTSFEGIATDITQKGRWLVGNGNYIGTGIYFGMSKKVARYYSDSNTIILVRVTLMFTRNISTTNESFRSNIGLGYNGDEISRKLAKPWFSTEYWRKDRKWFEYCIIQPPHKKGTFITTWRARPIAIVKNNRLIRIWGGKSIYPSFSSIFLLLLTWGFILCLIYNLFKPSFI